MRGHHTHGYELDVAAYRRRSRLGTRPSTLRSAAPPSRSARANVAPNGRPSRRRSFDDGPLLALLGAPRLRCEGRWYELPTARWVVLLAYLARCGGWVRREVLASLFWPEHDDHGANANLRQTLQTIVRSPASCALVREPSRVRWAGSSDVHAFEAMVESRSWEAAVKMYGGTFLHGIEVDEVATVQAWIEAERAGLNERWRTCALTLTAVWLDAHRSHQALALAERLHRDDPFDEEALRLKLRASVNCGDQRRAARTFEASRAFMQRELGVGPEPATVELATALGLVGRDG